MAKTIITLVIGLAIGLVVGWLLRHFLWKFPGFKSDTTRFFKQSGSKLKFYTTPTLIGTILVALAVLNVAYEAVGNFKEVEDKGQVVSERQYQLFRIKVMSAALLTWYSFINPAWQRARQKQQESETMPPVPPDPPQGQRLTTLG